MNKITNIPPEAAAQMSTQSTNNPSIVSQPESEGSSEQTAAQQEVPKAELQLSPADALLVHRALMSQEDGLARRSDLTELHKRIVQMLQTLNRGMNEAISQKAEKDRTALSARIDTLEDAVNRMEGALRIEFEPVLRRAMADVVAEQNKPKRHLGRQIFWTIFGLSAGTFLGAVYHSDLLAFAQQIVSEIATILG